MLKKLMNSIVAVFDFITKYFKTFVFLCIVAWIFFGTSEPKQTPNLARIYLKGMIIDSTPLRAQIEELKKYPSIKGVLLIIDSPGGSVGASVEMADLIQELSTKIPVVAHTESVMASGSYYVGAYANKVFANRGALVGSIGVIFSGFNVEELFKKIGYKPNVVVAGEYKEIGAYYREWTPKERAYLENLIKEEYQSFVADVAKARSLKTSDEESFAQGKVFNAPKAKALGLIDEVGSRNSAISALKELSGVEQEIWLEKSPLQSYLDAMLESSVNTILGAIFGMGLR